MNRRDFLKLAGAGVVAAGAASLLQSPLSALAGAGGGGSPGTGGYSEGGFGQWPYYEWYDTVNGNEQGHTVDSNLTFWNRYITQQLRDDGICPNNGFSMHSPDFGFTTPNAKNAIRTAMNRALARNAIGTFETAHVRVVGVAFIAGWSKIEPGKSTNIPMAYNAMDVNEFMAFCGMGVKPGLNSRTNAGVVFTNAGWSQTTLNHVYNTMVSDARTDFANAEPALIVWAVSDADLAFDVHVRKQSDRPDVTTDVSGAQYTLYTNRECTTVAKTVDGSNAVMTVGSDGYSNKIMVPRRASFEGSGNDSGTMYWVKETRDPNNGMFHRDEEVHRIKSYQTAELTIQGNDFLLSTVEKVKLGYSKVNKKVIM